MEGFELSQIGPGFLAPIHRKFMDVLAITRNLVSVTLFCLPITPHSIRCLSDLRSLHTLDLQYCRITSDFRSSIQPHDVVLSVYNFSLWITFETLSAWFILPFCHHLRTLSIFSPSDYNIQTPPPQFWTTCQFFPTLQRLSLEYIDSAYIPSLISSFWTVASMTRMPLTHFKLLTRRGIRDSDALFLLETLRDAPIEVLVFDGLLDAEPRLFDRITELYQQTLVGLTLIRRASNRQLKNRPVVWPRPTWEYAGHLIGLANLKHFGWNSDYHHITPTTSILLDFEQGFPADPSRDMDDERAHDINSIGWDALPFAANCPNLETFTNDELFLSAVVISRSNTGFISTKPLFFLGPSIRNQYSIDQWNTPTLQGKGWPHILPSTVDTKDA